VAFSHDLNRSGAVDVAAELFSGAAQPPPARPRVAPRQPVELQAGARCAGGTGVAVRVTDLSTHGFCMETHLWLAPGADIWLRLPSLEAQQARVAWVRGHLVGCAFAKPLHPLVADLLVSRFGARRC
jgi:hypothetical protein